MVWIVFFAFSFLHLVCSFSLPSADHPSEGGWALNWSASARSAWPKKLRGRRWGFREFAVFSSPFLPLEWEFESELASTWRVSWYPTRCPEEDAGCVLGAARTTAPWKSTWIWLSCKRHPEMLGWNSCWCWRWWWWWWWWSWWFFDNSLEVSGIQATPAEEVGSEACRGTVRAVKRPHDHAVCEMGFYHLDHPCIHPSIVIRIRVAAAQIWQWQSGTGLACRPVWHYDPPKDSLLEGWKLTAARRRGRCSCVQLSNII